MMNACCIDIMLMIRRARVCVCVCVGLCPEIASDGGESDSAPSVSRFQTFQGLFAFEDI